MSSAYKHGLDEEDIRHELRNQVRYFEQEYDGEDRLLVLRPSRDGTMLELVVVPAGDPTRVIHADVCRPKFLRLLGRRR